MMPPKWGTTASARPSPFRSRTVRPSGLAGHLGVDGGIERAVAAAQEERDVAGEVAGGDHVELAVGVDVAEVEEAGEDSHVGRELGERSERAVAVAKPHADGRRWGSCSGR